MQQTKNRTKNTKKNVKIGMPNGQTILMVPSQKKSIKKLQVQGRASANLRQFDMAPQSRSKKSSTGASYNDGFDVTSKPERRLVRVEEFDELVGTVTGQTAFTILAFACNPGQAAVFPRLSKFAVLYERYRWKKLEFYFQHDVSQFNAQGAAGLVILSGLYDAASATPTAKSQVEVTEPHVICMPNQNSLLRFNTSRLHPQGLPLFVRPGNLPGGADIKTYDAANVFVTVQGMAGAGEVGELHVRGQVEFIGDILDASAIAPPANNQVTILSSSASEPAGATTVAKNLLLADVTVNGLNVVNSSGSVVLPAGNYLIQENLRLGNTTSATDVVFQINKDAVPIIPVTPEFSVVQANASFNGMGSTCAFVSSNGTNVFTFPVTATYASGAATMEATVSIIAV